MIAGSADLIVATADASIGMGGPAMIAGGGLGDVHPDDVGPISMQAPNRVVDVVVADEAEAVAVTERLLGYFQGATPPGEASDQTRLRTMVPERARRTGDGRRQCARAGAHGGVAGRARWDGAEMAPLGEWSLEATVLVGARGMPGTVVSSNCRAGWDIPAA